MPKACACGGGGGGGGGDGELVSSWLTEGRRSSVFRGILRLSSSKWRSLDVGGRGICDGNGSIVC